ncbi:MarR family winged helix-turn-helix transcriptional regulator [Ensifer sp. 4252]|uniref:MarR family winged helix-turn-helix transcriptional regulator n=1 Tax=Ensifer sp. 4252 TaxID=3373915 RepID=UPI003D215D46
MSLENFYGRPGHLVRRLNQISVALFIEEAGDLGLTNVQFAALNMIRELPGIDQVTLSDRIAIDRTTIVKVLDRLVEKGFVTRDRSREDRRTNVLNITSAGIDVLNKILPRLDVSDARILEPLAPQDRDKFMEMLTRLVHVNNTFSRAPLNKRPDSASEEA